MGNCTSGGAPQHLIEKNDGGENEFHENYVEDRVLGEGEFGQVKLVHKIGKDKQPDTSIGYACKTLRKGAVFKHNTLYPAIFPNVLQGEIEILRDLGGKHYCLRMEAIYETPGALLLVTECCTGGEMMEYVSNRGGDLRTEDVSRISYQLFDALNHCAKNHIIHRDIKPENCMFRDKSLNAELRLIDFGCGTRTAGKAGLEHHTTFAGSAFYISPEMFQHTYTDKTDVWSAGVCLYVLVAGYPGDQLQKAFNLIQKAKNRNLKALPNLPSEMPDTYYEMLEKSLTYRHKTRPSAGEILKMDFAQFHIEHSEGIALDEVTAMSASGTGGAPLDPKSRRTASISLNGTGNRHALFMGFKQFEQTLTSLLTRDLNRTDLETLVDILKERVAKRQQDADHAKVISEETNEEHLEELDGLSQDKQLAVIQVRELKVLIRNEIGNHDAVAAMEKVVDAHKYDGFAYHIYLLAPHSRDPEEGEEMTKQERRMTKVGSFRQGPSSSGAGRGLSMRGMSMRGSARKSTVNKTAPVRQSTPLTDTTNSTS